MNVQPNIVVFMSDQHGADYSGWGSVSVDTPCLNEMRKNGVSFDACYSSCPICVPARMSMMSSLLPARTGVFGNNDTLADTTACFTHALVAAGYETVLVGRMHFVGQDQRHGFLKRLAPDITPVTWGRPFAKIKEQRGRTVATFADNGATELVGAGTSLVREYDRMVVDTAVSYLSQPHEKPQFILVGTYGPHFPYITSEEMYQKYLKRTILPRGFRKNDLPEFVKDNPVMNARVKDEKLSEQDALACLAAYLGQIEIMDSQIQEVRQATFENGKTNDRPVIFGYVSDHGDSCGENRLYGKRNYFDKAAKVPMLFEGYGIKKDRLIKTPVSLMDLGPTICELAGTSFLFGDGISLAPYLKEENPNQPERLVVSQMVDQNTGNEIASVMLRTEQYKYIHYHTETGDTLLFDMEQDPEERCNLSEKMPQLVNWFRLQEKDTTDFIAMEQLQREHDRNLALFKAYEREAGLDDRERWQESTEKTRGVFTTIAVDRIDELVVKFKAL